MSFKEAMDGEVEELFRRLRPSAFRDKPDLVPQEEGQIGPSGWLELCPIPPLGEAYVITDTSPAPVGTLPGALTDDNSATYAAESYPSGWIVFEYAEPITPDFVTMSQRDGNSTIGVGGFGKNSAASWKLQYWDGAAWQDDGTEFTGYSLGYAGETDGTHTSDQWRVVMLTSAYVGGDARNGWIVEEFGLYHGGAPTTDSLAHLIVGDSEQAARCDHKHPPEDILFPDGETLQDKLDAINDGLADHEAAADPHPVYMTEAEVAALIAATPATTRWEPVGFPDGTIWVLTDGTPVMAEVPI